MLVRLALAALGLAELLAPRRVVDVWVDLATEGDVEVRGWVYAAARAEGLLLLLWALSRGRGDGDRGDTEA